MLFSSFRHSYKLKNVIPSLNFFGLWPKIKISSLTFKRKPFMMKISSPEFTGLFSTELVALLDLFEKYNYEIRIAGGAVRDLLLGKAPKDIDFATTATPDQMKQMFDSENIRMINMKGEKHGTITARINNENFEVTTLRIDITTDGRHAEVQFTKDWELDANRRDLTINSMFLDRDGNIYDYFNGYDDLKKRRVAFVGNPNKRIQEDYLRILRYFRFYGRIADKPDCHEEETLQAITDNAHGLGKISGERIWTELSKILTGNYASYIVQRLITSGTAPYLGFPEKPNIGELISVWERGKNLNLLAMTLLVALMNNEEEVMSFHARCKLSSFERDLGLFIVRHRSIQSDNIKPYRILMFKTDGKPNDVKQFVQELLKYKTELNNLHEFHLWEPPKFPINGLILKEHGVPPGRKCGWFLKELKDFWADQDFQPSKDDLIKKIPELLKNVKSA